ncbi:MAG: branched-chain amino acid ABC transporter permease [Proteobacteria bacterium]|nr:branched-chain amino acid ABC transporter permease [Pseudomonadota bacterium]MBU1737136.1 branched-chain amino acid ABC transporter permease [Pseudomonadota bacterium]
MKKFLPVLILLTLVVAVQILTQLTGTTYYLTQLTMSAYYCVVIIGLCLLMGYAGQISLGHAGFFAIGGYMSAMLTTHNLIPYQNHILVKLAETLGVLVGKIDTFGEPLLVFHPWIACIIAILLALIIAFVIGIPVLKLKGHYLAMATLGFGIIIYRIALASAIFGEADGISEVPGFTLLPGMTVNGGFGSRISNYYIAWAMVLLTMLCFINLVGSRVGRALRAIHGSEDAANAMGVNTPRYKLKTFVFSAGLAALAGVFLTHYNGGIGPSEASIMKSVRYVAIVAIGGMANLWGALTMGVILNFLSLRGVFGSYDEAVFGTILIVIMLFAPEGLLRLSLLHKVKRFLGRGES